MSVASLAHRHHLLARRFAEGMSLSDAVCGTSHTEEGALRLLADQVFQLLISKYKEQHIGEANRNRGT